MLGMQILVFHYKIIANHLFLDVCMEDELDIIYISNSSSMQKSSQIIFF
jgi:hypothetical protein